MLTLREETFDRVTLPVSVGWLLADCMEFRGKQELWSRQRPEVLESLRQQAVIQSVESSNRIEGVTVAPDRLLPLAVGKARPRDRSEEELAGYRRALEWIYTRKSAIDVDARTIRHLHALAQAGAGDAGVFKSRDNEIMEVLPGGGRRVRFKPVPARQTPQAVEDLAAAYRRMHDRGTAPPLLIAATTVFDFLCIHPFRDGNGRVSRLLSTMLLTQAGLTVGRYVSLERLVEETKDDYYRVLAECSSGWHEGRNPILPWWIYFLSVLRRAYVEFANQVQNAAGQPAKTALVRRAILARVGPFTLADLQGDLPAVSAPLIKKVLNELKSSGGVSLKGRGRGAKWNVQK